MNGFTQSVIRYGDMALIQKELQKYEHSEKRREVLDRALRLAVKFQRDDAVILELIRLGADLDAENHGALREAVERGFNGAVKTLVQQGAAVNFEGDSPLYHAVLRNDIEMFHFLLDHGADPRKANALSLAVTNGNVEMVTRLLESGDNVHGVCLRAAAKRGWIDIVKILLKYGADFDNFNEALSVAAENGHSEIVQCLIESKADMYTDESKAFLLACENSHLGVIDAFLSAGFVGGAEIPPHIREFTMDFEARQHTKSATKIK